MTIPELIDALEKTEGPNFALEQEIMALLEPERAGKGMLPPNYTASIDAAVALCGRVLPGWTIASIGQDDRKGWHAELRQGHRTAYSTVALAGAPTPGLALSLAILKAKQAEEARA